MATLPQSELGEAASRLLRTANDQAVIITDGDREVGALVSMKYIDRVRQMALQRMEEIAAEASSRMDAHAAELGVSSEELLDRLLRDSDEL